jgi:hypothetical protein
VSAARQGTFCGASQTRSPSDFPVLAAAVTRHHTAGCWVMETQPLVAHGPTLPYNWGLSSVEKHRLNEDPTPTLSSFTFKYSSNLSFVVEKFAFRVVKHFVCLSRCTPVHAPSVLPLCFEDGRLPWTPFSICRCVS